MGAPLKTRASCLVFIDEDIRNNINHWVRGLKNRKHKTKERDTEQTSRTNNIVKQRETFSDLNAWANI